MISDPDDALRWEGDEPARSVVPAPIPAESIPEESIPEESIPAEEDEQSGVGNAALVFYGVVGGVYLLFAVGWAVGGMRLRPRAALIVADGMYLPWLGLAVLAPALWFAAAWVLTRGRATWIRILALIAGAVLLVPWPFVMVGTVG